MKENWKYKKLGEIASFSRGLTYSKNDVADYSTKMVLRSNNIDLDTNSLNLNDIAYLNDDFVIPGDKKLHKNNIFICMSNGSTQHLGKVAFIKDDLEYAFGGFMGSIIPNSNETEPKYVFYSCLSKEYRRFLKTVLNGININNLKWSDLKNFSIPVPPLPIQQQIVAELDLLSGIIEKQKQQLTELDKLAQATFYDMFGDPVTNEKGWEVKKLGEISIIKIGPFGSLLHAGDYIKNGHPVINPIHLKYGKVIADFDFTVSDKKFKELSVYQLEKNDIVFGRRGDIGRCAMIGENQIGYLCGTGCLIIHFTIEIIPQYSISSLLNASVTEYLLGKAKGATMLNINCRIIENMKTILPPLSLQRSFASKIEVIEKQKELINNSIKESQRLFDSRMEYWFG